MDQQLPENSGAIIQPNPAAPPTGSHRPWARHRMTVTVAPERSGSRLRVAIDYDLPERGAWLGRLFGGLYARRCVRRMTDDAQRALGGG